MTAERTRARWRGLELLIHDALEHGSRAIEKIHLETSGRPFAILEAIPMLAEPAKLVHEIHDSVVTGTYASIRLVNALVAELGEAAFDRLADDEPPSPPPPEKPS